MALARPASQETTPPALRAAPVRLVSPETAPSALRVALGPAARAGCGSNGGAGGHGGNGAPGAAGGAGGTGGNGGCPPATLTQMVPATIRATARGLTAAAEATEATPPLEVQVVRGRRGNPVVVPPAPWRPSTARTEQMEPMEPMEGQPRDRAHNLEILAKSLPVLPTFGSSPS